MTAKQETWRDFHRSEVREKKLLEENRRFHLAYWKIERWNLFANQVARVKSCSRVTKEEESNIDFVVIQKCGTRPKRRIEESWSSVCFILNLVSHDYWSKHATVFLTPNLFLLTVFTTVMKSYDKVEAVFRVTGIVICDFVVLKWCLCALVREVAL